MFVYRLEPLTWGLAIMGVGFYGIPSVWLAITKGLEAPWFIYIWGFTAVIFPLFFLYKTYQLKNYMQNHETHFPN